jgi:hypothetical protein
LSEPDARNDVDAASGTAAARCGSFQPQILSITIKISTESIIIASVAAIP